MKFEDLSPEDQKLVNTDLGDFEKEAAARLELANEMYEVGFNKLAAETADSMDEYFSKVASAEEVDNSISLDSESEKVAQELGAFIEKGYIDGLRKLGEERHGDETVYLMPFLEEKVAAKGAKAWLAGLGKKVKGFGEAAKSKAKDVGGSAKAKATAAGSYAKDKATAAGSYAKDKATAAGSYAKGKAVAAKTNVARYHSDAARDVKEGIKDKNYTRAAKGGGKLVGPYAAILGAGGAGAYAAKKKD
jgi:hypothetical protein